MIKKDTADTRSIAEFLARELFTRLASDLPRGVNATLPVRKRQLAFTEAALANLLARGMRKKSLKS